MSLLFWIATYVRSAWRPLRRPAAYFTIATVLAIGIVGLLKTLVKTKYAYHVALEYEVEAKTPVPGIVESIGFQRGVLAAI